MQTFESKINELLDLYSTTIVDLSPFFESNDERWLFSTMENIYKDYYEPYERIIFYFPNDQYLYSNDGTLGTLGTLIQQNMANLDISPYFVIVLTEDINVVQTMQKAHELYAIDSCNIKTIIVSSVPGMHVETKQFNASDTICSLLWDEVFVDSTAEVFPCCHAPRTNVFTNMNITTYMDIMNSDNFCEMRKNMLQGKKTSHCEVCYKLEDSNAESLRIRNNAMYNNIDLVEYLSSITSSSGEISVTPKKMVFGFRNTCNLKCITCTGVSSSMIRKEEIELHSKTYHIRDHISSIEYKRRFDILMPLVGKLEKIIFAGGEPLLLAEHFQILDALIALNKNSKIQLTYYTNLTLSTYRNIDIISYWVKFANNLKLNFSLDAMGNQGEYIRNGIEWDSIIANYIRLKKTLPSVTMCISTTIGMHNAFAVMPFHKKWVMDGLIDPENLQLKLLVSPEYMSLCVLPEQYKSLVNDQIIQHIEWLSTYPKTDEIILQWKDAIQFMWDNDQSHLITQFYTYIDRIDNHRNLSFDDTFPEYSDLRTYI